MFKDIKNAINQDEKRNSGNGIYLRCYLKLYRLIKFVNTSHKAAARVLDFYRNNIYAHRNVVIPVGAVIGGGLRIPHLIGIVISENAVIGENCTIFQNVTIGASEKANGNRNAPRIGNNVYIGAGAIIIGPIIIGNDVNIGAGAIVTRDVPDQCTVIGINQHFLKGVEE